MTLSKILVYPALVIAAFAVAVVAYAEDGTKEKHSIYRGGGEPTVSIGARGNVLVRGATVTAVSANEITAETEWEGAELVWDVDTDGDTDYVGASGRAADRDDIEVGDTVSFSGTLESSLSVDAGTVRNWSDDNEDDDDHLTGEVKSVGNGSFVVESGNRSVTVDVDGDTDFTIGKEEGELADLEVGTKVRIAGHYDGDEFVASSVTAVALGGKGRDWRPFLDFFHSWKMKWN